MFTFLKNLKIGTRAAGQETFLGTFRINGTQEQGNFYKETMVGPDVEEVDRMRKAANDTGLAASQIKDASGELSRQSELLENEVEKFLNSIKAA